MATSSSMAPPSQKELTYSLQSTMVSGSSRRPKRQKSILNRKPQFHPSLQIPSLPSNLTHSYTT